MALFTLSVQCEGVGGFVTQAAGSSPQSAIRAFLKRGSLNQFLAPHPDWPTGFQFGDIYLFIPLEGLVNVYLCGLGQRGKYVQIHLFHTVRRSTLAERKCARLPPVVTLRT